MAFRHFSIALGLRIALLTLVLVGWICLFVVPQYPTLHLLLTALVLLQAYEIFRLVSRTNTELTRFLEAVRYADFGQRFQMRNVGAGFEELGSVFTEIIERFQAQRSQQEEDLRHLRALTEHVPVPLMSLHADGRVQLHNNAARRLFGSTRITRLEDISAFGEDFSKQVLAVEPGERRLALFQLDDLEQQLTISATEIVIAGKMEKLVSLLNIQSELDGVQLQAWQDLVRVLTHEIMNSITPVASLAKTAVELVDDATQKLAGHPDVVEELADVKSAVETVARRSDGLMQFVQSYRRITRLPPPRQEQIRLSELFANVEQLVNAEWVKKGIVLAMSVEPRSLELTADPDMIEQVMLNILQNAEQVLTGRDAASVSVVGYLNRQGHVSVEISDNGPGVSAEIAKKIFVPFFTTKREGSGVGLALTRQVMLAHGGTATLGTSDSGGAKFTLTFLANMT
jgi:nitrogen fixation/metabolism regulation signal transduction histidine kinase